MSWQAGSLSVLVVVLAGGFLWYERSRPPARVLALVAAMAALAVVGRLAFAAIPNVKPTTDIVLFAGFALGAVPGFVVGAVTAIASNVFLGQGPWTAWQMIGWGAVGTSGALLALLMRRREVGRVPLALACGLAGAAFGAWMDVYQWTLAARQDLDTYLLIAGSSLPYNAAHVIGNVAFALLIGPPLVRALRRYRRRFEVVWEAPSDRGSARAGVAVAALGALALAGGGAPHSAGAAAPAESSRAGAPPPATATARSPAARAAAYLLRAQNRDGGFPSSRGGSSSQLLSGWSSLGLAAAGRNPRDVRRRGGRSAATYLLRSARGLRDIGELERTILVLRAAGLSARSFAGRDLVAGVLRRRRADGSIAGYVSYTAFGLLALEAAGQPLPPSSLAWLERVQNEDGGYGVAPSATSDTDMTGAVLQVLALAGRARGEATRRATGYLQGSQGPDGGFPQMRGRSSNAQSTAYAVQGLVATRAAPGRVRLALRYLTRLQSRDGSVRYSRTSAQTPVWVTAQALMALERKALPLGVVPRRRRAEAAAVAPPARAKRSEGGAGKPAGKRAGKRARKAPKRAAEPRMPPREPRPPSSVPEPPNTGPALGRTRTTEQADGPPAALIGGAGGGTVLLLALLRRRLRRADGVRRIG